MKTITQSYQRFDLEDKPTREQVKIKTISQVGKVRYGMRPDGSYYMTVDFIDQDEIKKFQTKSLTVDGRDYVEVVYRMYRTIFG